MEITQATCNKCRMPNLPVLRITTTESCGCTQVLCEECLRDLFRRTSFTHWGRPLSVETSPNTICCKCHRTDTVLIFSSGGSCDCYGEFCNGCITELFRERENARKIQRRGDGKKSYRSQLFQSKIN